MSTKKVFYLTFIAFPIMTASNLASSLFSLAVSELFHIHAFHSEIANHLLHRNVSSDQILKSDPDGNCYIPPFCNLDTNVCNVARLTNKNQTLDKFLSEYDIPQKPDIVHRDDVIMIHKFMIQQNYRFSHHDLNTVHHVRCIWSEFESKQDIISNYGINRR